MPKSPDCFKPWCGVVKLCIDCAQYEPPDPAPANPAKSGPTFNRYADAINEKTGGMTTPELIQAAREHNRLAIANTATGAWLDLALRRLASEHQNASGKEH